MSEIFISYAREDREQAQAIAAVFQEQGWSVWWDRSIPPGRSFDQVIEEALAAARCVVVIWSKASATSDWVKTEAAEGLSRKILVPVRTEEINLPLEFRRLQTVDLTHWKGDAHDPELGEFLAAVSALIKSEVRPPPSPSPSPIRHGTRIKPAYLALAALVLLAIAWSIYSFKSTRDHTKTITAPGNEVTPTVPSPTAGPEKKPVADLMRTPELGLEFWQQKEECPMFIVDSDTSRSRVVLKPEPFEIRSPRLKEAIQICAWSDNSIFDEIAPGKKLTEVRYFSPGTGMADSAFGTPHLRLENLAHNGFDDSRRRTISEQQDSIFISSLTRNQEPLTSWPTTYLVVFVDLDRDEEVGFHEFERIELDFSR